MLWLTVVVAELMVGWLVVAGELGLSVVVE